MQEQENESGQQASLPSDRRPIEQWEDEEFTRQMESLYSGGHLRVYDAQEGISWRLAQNPIAGEGRWHWSPKYRVIQSTAQTCGDDEVPSYAFLYSFDPMDSPPRLNYLRVTPVTDSTPHTDDDGGEAFDDWPF